MLGVENYGSGSESEREDSVKPRANANAKSLPTVLPAPKGTAAPKAKRPKKITIGLPSLPTSVEEEQDEPPAKKARTSGAGASSLLSMLPAPKQAVPVPQRVLGGKSGPGLVFNAPRSIPSQPVDDQEASEPLTSGKTSKSTSFLPPSLVKGKANISLEDEPKASSKPAAPSRPSSVDFFALGVSSR
jgi:proline-rich protein PRCC